MDAMAFGMGCCCLQVTFQAKDIAESRYLYDQLSVLSPIFMALTAGSPVFRGKLVDTDTRWDVIASSVDCRTPIERGISTEPLAWQTDPDSSNSAGSGRTRIFKSRYDTIDCFISSSPLLQDKYNDVPLVCDPDALATLLANGVDERLARHIAHLWIRDPLVVFSDRIAVDDTKSSEHFENIQSTNWQNVRWKPPPPDAKNMGWRVELRTMEVQLTDMENAAFTVFSVLMSRVILFFELNLYIPVSKVDENMAVARLRNAICTQKFHFRSYVVPLAERCGIVPTDPEYHPDSVEFMTCEEILTGRGEYFPGLIPIIFTYLDVIGCDEETRSVVSGYLELIVQRAKGTLPTFAQWMRKEIMAHPAYKHDSNVSQEIAFDVLSKCRRIAAGEPCPELLGRLRPRSFNSVDSESAALLRGASFSEAFPSSECAVLKSLLERHIVRKSFAETPAFL